MRALGLRDAVAARGTRVRRAEIRNPRGELLTRIDYEALGWETYGILRSELQQAMLGAVPAERFHLGTTCVGATADGQALLDGAEPLAGDVVVGADGIGSAVRRSLFGQEPLRYGGHRAWRAGTRFADERVRDRFVEVWGVGGGFGFGPAGTGRVYWYCFEAVPESAPAPERRLVRADSRADRIDGCRRNRADVHLRQAAAPGESSGRNAVVRASRRAGRAAEVRSPLGTRVRDAVMKALPDRLSVAQQRSIVEFGL